MEAVTKWRGPPLALSWLTRVTVIWLGGCLAVCTLDSCASTFPPPFALHWPRTSPFSLKQGTMQAFPDNLCPCATSRGMPCTKILSLDHLAHASWPPRRVVIVLHHCLSGEIVTYWLLCKCKADYLADFSEHHISHFLWNNMFYSRSTAAQLHILPSGSCSAQSHFGLMAYEKPIGRWGAPGNECREFLNWNCVAYLLILLLRWGNLI